MSLSDFADKTEFNRFRRKRFPNEKRMKSYPAGKLCRFVTVDAYRSAMPFYEKNGFLPLLEEDDGEMTRLLYFDLADYKNSMQD